MLNAIMLIVINILTDIIPYISILEVKFIEIFKDNSIRKQNLTDYFKDD
jgi:hypothetical protein